MSELDNHVFVYDASHLVGDYRFRAMFTDVENEYAITGYHGVDYPLVAYGNTPAEAIDRLVKMTFMIAGV